MTTDNTGNSTAPRREVRIGLVLYGGVSLAIYIYGVCQEFLRLVQASAALGKNGGKVNTYAEVLHQLEAKATVDIIAGASAGGINGVALAKATTQGASLDELRRVWVNKGDLAGLMHSPRDPSPESLLDSRRYEDLVKKALDAMDAKAAPDQQCAEVLDLFITATDLYGRRQNDTDFLGEAIQTKDHRKVFQRKYRSRKHEYLQDDFSREHNAFLAKLCHATSAFPVAIEPATMDANDLKGVDVKEGEDIPLHLSDGGILDNKPFTDMLRTIFSRSAAGQVDRVLFYVEPDPAPPEDPPKTPRQRPDVLTVASKAKLGIPSYESIAADLQSLLQHNIQVRRLQSALSAADALKTTGYEDRVFRRRLEEQFAYHAYHHLKLSSLKEDISAAFRNAVGKDNADANAALQAEMARRTADEQSTVKFLKTFDLAFQVRRYHRLIEVLTPLYPTLSEKQSLRSFLPSLGQLEDKLWQVSDRARHVDWLAWNLGTEHWPGQFRRELLALEKLRGDEARRAVVSYVAQVEDFFSGEINRDDRDPAGPGIRARGDQVCRALDNLASVLRAAGVSGLPSSFVHMRDQFELRDVLLYPISLMSSLGERDEVQLVRVSPDAARFIRRPQHKLAGTAMAHFGGFLKREWRQSDIMWGRLDAAELIVRTLAKNAPTLQGASAAPKPTTDDLVRTVHKEIIREEMATLKAEAAPSAGGDGSTILDRLASPSDYQPFLEDVTTYTVGVKGTAEISKAYGLSLVANMLKVVSAMMDGVEQQPNARGLSKVEAAFLGAVVRLIGTPFVPLSWLATRRMWPLMAVLMLLLLVLVLAVTAVPLGFLVGIAALGRGGRLRTIVAAVGLLAPMASSGGIAWALLANLATGYRLAGAIGLPIVGALLLASAGKAWQRAGRLSFVLVLALLTALVLLGLWVWLAFF
jgi:patatin-related protein